MSRIVSLMAELTADEIRPTIAARLRRGIPWAGLILAKLWLVDGQRLIANGALTIDDEWFVERASWISAGRWLGPWEYRTLIKQPGYPIFIAALHSFRVPLLLAHQLVYIAAIALTMIALRPLLHTRRRRLCAFAVLVFNPMTMNTAISARVDRAGIYPALLLCLLACLVGLVTSCERRSYKALAWGFGASLALGAVWLVREEWLLVLPAVAVGLTLAIARVARTDLRPLPKVTGIIGVALIPLSVLIGTVILEHVNNSRYGLAVINIEQTSMSEGIGPMFRVTPTTTFDRYPITAETRASIYAVSPQFAALRDQIEHHTDPRYLSRRPDGVQDFDGQVFQWVVLDAINATGSASNAQQLDATFRSIGSEINAACADDRLRCSGPHTGIAPEWQWSRLPALLQRTLTGLRKTVDLNAFTALSSPGQGAIADRALFSKMTNEPLAPGPNDFLTRQRVHLISAFRLLYRLLAVAALCMVVVRCSRAVRARQRPSWSMLTVVGLGVLLLIGRTVGLAFLDLTAFPAFAVTYLASGYACALVVAVALTMGHASPVGDGTTPASDQRTASDAQPSASAES